MDLVLVLWAVIGLLCAFIIAKINERYNRVNNGFDVALTFLFWPAVVFVVMLHGLGLLLIKAFNLTKGSK